MIASLIQYIVRRTSTNPVLSQIGELFGQSSTAQVGLILTERLINIPLEVVPPMYNMLLEEISWAVEEKEPYTFSHYLILSKTYQEIVSSLDEDKPQRKKKKTSSATEQGGETFYFHPEDEVLHKQASAYGSFSYVKEEDDGQADSKRAFQDLGIKPQGHMILLEAPRFESAVKALQEFMRASN